MLITKAPGPRSPPVSKTLTHAVLYRSILNDILFDGWGLWQRLEEPALASPAAAQAQRNNPSDDRFLCRATLAALVRGPARHPPHPCPAQRRPCSNKRAEAVPDTGAHINFGAPAVLRKWPSLNKERISSASPYSVAEGTLDECIRQFSTKPISQQHLYEIHTAPQGELVTAVLSAKQIIELARLRDFL
jgi:hypothetical protein